MVSAITYKDGKIYSGGKDKQIIVSDPSSGEAERTIQADHLVRAIDVLGDKILCGLLSGSIVEFEGDSPNTLMQGHSMGEAWGLCPIGDDEFATTGDDNMVKVWSISKKECIYAGEVCNENAKPRKGKASTLSRLAASKCARAIAYDQGTGNLAIGHNDGRVTIRSSKEALDDVTATLQDSDEWIETMAYSPCGKFLAVGSHDNNIYLYNVGDNYTHVGTGKAHKSFIVSLDWSADSTFIRTVCGAHELLFFTVGEDGAIEQDQSGATNTTETEWASSSNKYGWLVTGIFPSGTDGTHINHVDHSADGSLVVTGDDFGLVNIWRNPALKGHRPISLRGHSEHVVRTRFMQGDNYIISIGGYDKTVFQWKKA